MYLQNAFTNHIFNVKGVFDINLPTIVDMPWNQTKPNQTKLAKHLYIHPHTHTHTHTHTYIYIYIYIYIWNGIYSLFSFLNRLNQKYVKTLIFYTNIFLYYIHFCASHQQLSHIYCKISETVISSNTIKFWK